MGRLPRGTPAALKRARRSASVQSAARAIRIMRSLFLAPEGKHLSEVSEEVDLHRATALRLLATLVEEGVVERGAERGLYRIHPISWLSMLTRMPTVFSVAERIQAVLRGLTDSTGATALTVVPDAGKRKMVATMWALPKRPLRIDPAMRGEVPMHAAAAGKCFLASLTPEQLSVWLKPGLPKLTDHTTTSASKLRRELAAVRRQGYAVEKEEFILGVSALATPVCDQAGAVVMALSLVCPAHEITTANIARWLPLLRTASEAVFRTVLVESAAAPQGS